MITFHLEVMHRFSNRGFVCKSHSSPLQMLDLHKQQQNEENEECNHGWIPRASSLRDHAFRGLKHYLHPDQL